MQSVTTATTVTKEMYPHGWTIINNDNIRDLRLSFTALGFMVYLISLPKDWRHSEAGHLKNNSGRIGADALSSILKELEQCGYLRREQKRTEGRFGQSEWIINPNPVTTTSTTTAAAAETSAAVTTAHKTVSSKTRQTAIQNDSTQTEAAKEATDTCAPTSSITGAPIADFPPTVEPSAVEPSRADIDIHTKAFNNKTNTKNTKYSSSKLYPKEWTRLYVKSLLRPHPVDTSFLTTSPLRGQP